MVCSCLWYAMYGEFCVSIRLRSVSVLMALRLVVDSLVADIRNFVSRKHAAAWGAGADSSTHGSEKEMSFKARLSDKNWVYARENLWLPMKLPSVRNRKRDLIGLLNYNTYRSHDKEYKHETRQRIVVSNHQLDKSLDMTKSGNKNYASSFQSTRNGLAWDHCL